MPLSLREIWDQCSTIGTTVTKDNVETVVTASVPTLSCLPPLITSFIDWALIFAGIVAIFLTIYAGYKYINSGGDPKQADTARKTLMYTVFGLILIFLSFFIVRFIGQVSGLDKNCYSMFGFSNCASDTSTGGDKGGGNTGGGNELPIFGLRHEGPKGTFKCDPANSILKNFNTKDACVIPSYPQCVKAGDYCGPNPYHCLVDDLSSTPGRCVNY